MPISRSYRKKPMLRKRRTTQRKRVYRRPGISRMPNANKVGIHYFKRTVNAVSDVGLVCLGAASVSGSNRVDIVASAGLAGQTQYGSMTYFFSIGSLPNVSEFTGLFDSYRIHKVVVKIIPYGTSADTSFPGAPNNSASQNAILHYAIDHDDVGTPSSNESGIQTLQQYNSYKTRRLVGGRPISIVIKPRYATPAYQTSTFSAYTEGNRRTWLDCAYSQIEHYGLKAVVETIAPNSTESRIPCRMETTYYMSFKGVR